MLQKVYHLFLILNYHIQFAEYVNVESFNDVKETEMKVNLEHMVINVCTCHLNIYMFTLSLTASLTIKLTSEGPRALKVRAKILMTQRVYLS